MENKVITFKNGCKMIITQQVADLLRDRILSGIANDFQCISDEKDNTLQIIRLSDISFLG